MGKRRLRPLYPPKIDIRGREAITRLVDADYEGVDWEAVTHCRFEEQPDITQLPPFGAALVELDLWSCAGLASLAGIERAVGLTSLKLTAMPAAWIAAELARLAELPDLSRVVIVSTRGPLPPEAFAALATLPGLLELELVHCDLDQRAAIAAIGELPILRRLTVAEHVPWRLEDALAPLVGLRALALHACVELPRAIGGLTALEELAVVGLRYKERTKIRRLPAALGKCAALRRLSVEGPITAVPDEICDLAALEELILVGGEFATLPAAIGKLGRLRVLDVRSELTALPESIGDLAALRRLTLWPSYRHPCAIPDAIARLAVEEFTGPEAIGGRIARLPAPTPESDHVKLADADRIPADFGDPLTLKLELLAHRGPLPQLRALRRLTRATIAVGDLAGVLGNLAHLAHLEELEIAGILDELPAEIGGLTRLRRLRLAGSMALLPSALGELAALEELELHAPRLVALPEGLVALTSLEIEAPALRDLPALPGLRALVLRDVGFSVLPEAVAAAPVLASLTLDAPLAGDYGRLRALTSLELRTLPPRFAEIVAALATTPIEHLELCDVDFLELPPAIGRLTTLAKLTLEDTRIAQLPPEIADCIALRSISLPKPQFRGDPRPLLPPGKWSKREWKDQMRCERYR